MVEIKFLKCDRCGKNFEITAETWREVDWSSVIKHHHLTWAEGLVDADLCEDCGNALYRFIHPDELVVVEK